MPELNIFEPTQVRSFTFYDRCAIKLDRVEQTACRIRISVTILGSPVGRSLNLKYPYSKEFYGYMQTFYLASLYEEFPVSYPSQVLLDFFEPHTALAHQLTDVFQRMALYFISLGNAVAALTSAVSLELAQALLDVVVQTFNLAFCFTLELEGGSPDTNYENDFLNVFQIPFNLIRFKFPFGTVFNVAIDSWNLGELQTGGQGGNPETDPPFDTTNPNAVPPFPTPGGNDPENPYGADPPESSPLDPTLDPGDFSNAPEPVVEDGYRIRVVGDVQITGIDAGPRAVNLESNCFNEPVVGVRVTEPGGTFEVQIQRPDGSLIVVFFDADNLGTAAIINERCFLS